jgi:hypothetical protein
MHLPCESITESLRKTIDTSESHIFHSNCFARWSETNDKCPVCQNTISKKTLNFHTPLALQMNLDSIDFNGRPEFMIKQDSMYSSKLSL